MLSGKAEEDFKKWLGLHISIIDNGCPDSCTNALITEWLDTVGIHIEISRLILDNEPPVHWFYSVEGSEINKEPLKIRNKATIKALEEAIEIYNKK